jgi:hypothetical protein
LRIARGDGNKAEHDDNDGLKTNTHGHLLPETTSGGSVRRARRAICL